MEEASRFLLSAAGVCNGLIKFSATDRSAKRHISAIARIKSE
jgi:hypothetical protein